MRSPFYSQPLIWFCVHIFFLRHSTTFIPHHFNCFVIFFFIFQMILVFQCKSGKNSIQSIDSLQMKLVFCPKEYKPHYSTPVNRHNQIPWMSELWTIAKIVSRFLKEKSEARTSFFSSTYTWLSFVGGGVVCYYIFFTFSCVWFSLLKFGMRNVIWWNWRRSKRDEHLLAGKYHIIQKANLD